LWGEKFAFSLVEDTPTEKIVILELNDTVGPSVPMKCGANGKTAKVNVCGPIFANFSTATNEGTLELFV